ncbi:MAG: peptidase MA family metallohydrolase [Tepidisphaerales bacterium]
MRAAACGGSGRGKARAFVAAAVTTAALAGHHAAHAALPDLVADHPLVRSASPWRLLQRMLPEPADGLEVPAYADTRDRAEAELRAGLYRRAIYRVHGVDDVRAARVRSRAHAALGEWEAALTATAGRTEAVLRVERSRVLAELGRLSEARAEAAAAVEADPTSLPARLEVGRLAELAGDVEAARAAYAWFVRPEDDLLASWRRDGERRFDRGDDAVALGRALDRWATLEGKYRGNPGLNQTILGIFVRVYDVIDRGHPEAHLAAARYQLGHDDPDAALAEVRSALAVNPRHPEAHELAGELMLLGFNFDGAEQAIRALTAINPACPRAELLRARSELRQRRPRLAEGVLQRRLQSRPDDVVAIGLLAAVHALRLEEAEADRLLKRADDIAPGDARALYEVAEQLAAMRQYPRAETMYLRAIDRAPWWTAPRNALGLLYTQWGDDAKARATLEQAHELDPFNLRTVNYLRLLDRLDGMARLRSDRFEVRFDAARDPLIGELMLEYLESVHGEVAGLFDHEPDVHTIVEVYPTHAQFSVRTTGTPWIGTVGASTGRVIAMVAPRRGADTQGTYNWAQVLRHEYAHTVTLSATENRIPHWLTEGLAVFAEDAPLRWEWVPLLHQATLQHRLFDLEQLTWGFVRPRRPSDRPLAYAQSYWMCRYLIDTYGREAMLRLLSAFRAGKSESDAFIESIGREPAQFHAEFVRWAQRQVATWGYDRETTARYEQLRERGEELIAERRLAEAVEVWEQLHALRPMDALPRQRLAGLYLSPEVNDKARARAHLEALHAVELKDNRLARRLSRLAADMGDDAAAVRFAREAVWIDPYDLAAHRLLLEQAERAGDAATVAAQRRRLEVLQALAKPSP